MTPQHQIVKIESVQVWVTRLPSLSHPPLSMWRHRVTCLPSKNASALGGGPGSRWLAIIIRQVSYIQYLLACQKSQRYTPYNIVKNGFPWKRVFRRRHLGRRVTAVTCLRWPTVSHQPPFPECWDNPTCQHRCKRLPDNSTIFATEATSITRHWTSTCISTWAHQFTTMN